MDTSDDSKIAAGQKLGAVDLTQSDHKPLQTIARRGGCRLLRGAETRELHMAGSNWERVYKMAFASVYPQYVRKLEAKGRTKTELDETIRWLTGYSQEGLQTEIAAGTSFETFFAKAPKLNPAREQIRGLICGQRVEEIEEPLTREIRYLDKLVDELARGRALEKVLRHQS